MSDLEASIVIARPPDEVWTYVADLAKTPEWRTSVRSVVPPDELTAGSSFVAGTRVLGRDWQWRLVLDDVDPPTALSYSVSEGFTRIRVTYRLAPIDEGCRFTLAAWTEPDRVVERLLQPIAAVALRRQARRHLANLKARLERPQADRP